MTTIRRFACFVATLCILALVGAVPALGATHVWIGAANGLWSASGNWSGGVPTTGESGGTIVQFNQNTTSAMNISALAVDQIHFTGANNVIGGTTGLTINGSNLQQNIVSDANGNTFSGTLPLTLAGASVEAASNSGTLTIDGTIGGADGFVTTGIGAVALSGSAPNTYTGATTILSGDLHISDTIGHEIVGSALNVGTGAGPGARLLLEQSSDISPTTPVVVNSDGVFDFQGYADTAQSLTVNGGNVLGANLVMSGALVMNGGTITVAAVGGLTAGSAVLTGGSISGAGPGGLALNGSLQATSSATGPATIAAPVRLGASPTITVTPGTAPELLLTGVISETGGSRSITKAGAGTLLTSAANTYTGTTSVTAGTLIADGSQTGSFAVGPSGTLTGSGVVGATTVAGTIAPTAPGLQTGALTIASTGKLSVALTSVAPASIPSLDVTGAVAIDPSASASVTLPPAGTAAPHGSVVRLISNDASDPITGQFNTLVGGSTLTTSDGVPLGVSYAGNDGNDLTLTAGNVAPSVTSVSAVPSRVAAGRPVAFRAIESDANQDPLTTTWSFGDGGTGTGTSTSHTYAKAGTYTVTAVVSDGIAQGHATAVVKIPVAGTKTVKSRAFGADFGLTVPAACVQKQTRFTATLTVTFRTASRTSLLSKVTKVVFAVNGRTAATRRSAPFRAQLGVPAAAASGSALKLGIRASLKLRSGGSRSKRLTTTVKVC